MPELMCPEYYMDSNRKTLWEYRNAQRNAVRTEDYEWAAYWRDRIAKHEAEHAEVMALVEIEEVCDHAGIKLPKV